LESELNTKTPVALKDLISCPADGSELALQSGKYRCAENGHQFEESESGLPLLYWPTDDPTLDGITDLVKEFYEDNPFPSYDSIDSAQTLEARARAGFFARLLNEQIPFGETILEAGCGTGQLSNYLGLRWGRSVIGADLCLNSLHMGEQFRNQNEISQVSFCQMNLFRPPFRKESFDTVISNGVLMHTFDPHGAFDSIATLVKPGGHILIGLYNRFGRISTVARRHIFRITRGRFRFLDPHLRRSDLSDQRKNIWFADQYLHPQESLHTLDEVLGWFDSAGFDFVSSIPKPRIADTFSRDEQLFEPISPGTRADRWLTQIGSAFTTGREGGLFIVIGKKK